MNFLKSLFGAGGQRSSKGRGNAEDGRALLLYVRPKRCDEIVQVRIDLWNDLSERDEGGYFARKLARGRRCPFESELHLTFNARRELVEQGLQNGEWMDEAAYRAWQAAQSG